MIPLPRDFREFIQLLNRHRVRYLIVGGYAVGYHGYPRYTGDLDVFVELTQKNAEALAEVLRRFGMLEKGGPEKPWLKQGTIVRMGRDPLRLEIMNDIDGVTFAQCHARRVRANLGGLTVNFISLPDLITNKKASGRYKDLADVDCLRKPAEQQARLRQDRKHKPRRKPHP